jgi:hypothetical protein
MKGQLEQKKL